MPTDSPVGVLRLGVAEKKDANTHTHTQKKKNAQDAQNDYTEILFFDTPPGPE